MDAERREKMNNDKKKVSTKQLIILLDEIEKDPSLLAARNNSRNGRIFYVEKWERVAKKLNAVEKGCWKSVSKWQQALRDWKSNTKRKASKTSTDGSVELTNLETRLLFLCDRHSSDVESKISTIDTSSITEVDPLTSSDESLDDQDTLDSEDKQDQPSGSVTEYVRDGKRVSSDNDEVKVKRRRVQMFSGDTELKTEILSRLASLEASKEEATRQAKMLENIAVTLDRYVTATDRQADAIARQADVLSRIVDMLERITGLANGVAN